MPHVSDFGDKNAAYLAVGSKSKGRIMANTAPLHPSTHRKNLSTLSQARQMRLRQLIDTYIITRNPVAEHAAARNDMALDLHGAGFLAWHSAFLAKLENWLVTNGGAEFVPLPYFDPAKPIPAAFNKSNTDPNFPLPNSLRPTQVAKYADYTALNNVAVDYHDRAHGRFGGQMPFAQSSPSDPIFWPFHALLVALYEHWRSH